MRPIYIILALLLAGICISLVGKNMNKHREPYILTTQSEAVYDLTIEQFPDAFIRASITVEHEEDSNYKTFTIQFRPEYQSVIDLFIYRTWGKDSLATQ